MTLEYVPYTKSAWITAYDVWVTSGDGGVSPTIQRSMWLWPLLFRHNIALGAVVILLWPYSRVLLVLAHLSKARWAFVILDCPASVICHPTSSVVNNFSVYTLTVTVLIQSSSNLLRMFVLMISRSCLIMGGMGSKSRSLGQILEKSCLHSSSNMQKV